MLQSSHLTPFFLCLLFHYWAKTLIVQAYLSPKYTDWMIANPCLQQDTHPLTELYTHRIKWKHIMEAYLIQAGNTQDSQAGTHSVKIEIWTFVNP